MEVRTNKIADGKRRKRTLIAGSVKSKLEKHFEIEQKPSMEAVAELAESLRIKRQIVRIWFCNRRYREKHMKPLTTSNTSASPIPAVTEDPANSETLNNLSPVRSTVESSPMKHSLQPSVQGSTVSSGTSRKRTIIEGPPKDALEKHFGKETKPSLATITSLAASLRMKPEVVSTWFANRRYKEKRLKLFTALMTPLRRTRLSASRILRSDEIFDETAETIQTANGSNSPDVHSTELSGIELDALGRPSLDSVGSENSLVDPDKEAEAIPASEHTAVPEITSSPSNSTEPSETSPINHRTSGGSFRNGRPWGPLSRRQPVTENQIEQDQVEILETPRELTKQIRFAERLIKRCKKIGNRNEMDVYAIPLIKSAESSSTFERFSFCNSNERAEHRTVLVLGADGSSRAKFINGIVNFILGVEQADNFRFQLIDEEETNSIKIYDIHHSRGCRVTFSITIVAVPSYDTITDDSQYFRDQNVAKTLLGLLESDGGIHQLDMICNVVTEAVFSQSFMSIFGKDMAGSLSNWQPFDHLGDTCSWREVIQRFCSALADRDAKSLSLTKQVLEERERMDAVMNGLESLIKISHVKMKEVGKTKQMIVFCDSQIQSTEEEEDECFVVEMKKKVELPAGEWVYNCNRCYVTCHDSFFKQENVEDGNWNSDDLYESTVTGYCSVCPDQCNLIMHSNQPYRWVSVEKETKISPDPSKIERNEAEVKWKDIRSKGRDRIRVLEKDLAGNGKVILEHFVATWRCIQRLNRIALRGNSFLTQKVFDVLYDAEQQLKELGLHDGLASLKN